MTRSLKLISAGIGAAAMLGVMGASTFANFTASPSKTEASNLQNNNGFQAGTVTIAVQGGSNKYMEMTESPSVTNSATFDTVGNMAPGDTWSKVLTVRNTGTLPELYQLTVTTNSGRLFQSGFTGSNGMVSSGGPATITVTGTTKSGSDPLVSGSSNAATNSSWILINPGDQETLTVAVHLPFTANNAYEGTQGSFSIAVNAQQADNYGNKNNSQPVKGAIDTALWQQTAGY